MGQRFGKHIDDSVEVEGMGSTAYTLLVYLSGSPAGTATSESDAGGASTSGTGQTNGKGGAGKRKVREGDQANKQAAKGAARAAAAEAPNQPHQGPGIFTTAVQGLEGGETMFYGDRCKLLASVRPQPGLALLHLHGEDKCLEHEAAVVRSGTKYVLRSDVVFA